MASIKKNFVYQIGYQLLISILPFISLAEFEAKRDAMADLALDRMRFSSV